MILYRSILFTLFFFCVFCARAQDSNYVYTDSAIFQAETVVADTAESEMTDTVENIYYPPDTVLRDNALSLEADSVRAIKNLQSLAYAKSLDSLLHQYQQDQKRDIKATKNNLSWIARFFLSPVTKYFFLLLAVVFTCFILYRLFFAEGFLQRSYAKPVASVLPEEDESLSKTADYAKLIQQAVTSRNFRMAVRYHYLQSLQKLAAKGLVQLARDKTNYQYVNELSGKKYKNDFASLTLNYEYVWYGEFEIDETIFNRIQQGFKQFNNEV